MLTNKETILLNSFSELFKKCEDKYGRDYSDIEMRTLLKNSDWETNTVKGVLGSLINKGYIYPQDVNGQYNIFYLTIKARDHLN